MDRKYYSPIRSYLTPEQIRHERESSDKIDEKYGMSNTGMLRTFIGVGGAIFLTVKDLGLIAKVWYPTLTGSLTTCGAFTYVTTVSVFHQMIIIKLI